MRTGTRASTATTSRKGDRPSGRPISRTRGPHARPRVLLFLCAAIEETGAQAWSPFVHEERALLARLEGDGPTAERELCEAHRLFVAIGAAGHATRLTKELG